MKFTFLLVKENMIEYDDDGNRNFLVKKSGEFMFEDFNIVNCVSHRMNKKTVTLL